MAISPVRDADGRIAHFVGIKEDIGEHKRVEAKLQEMNRDLQRLAKEAQAARERAEAARLEAVRDLAERKAAEEALARSELRYRQLFEQDLTGNFVTTPEGRILACNQAFARTFGFASIDEALGTNALSLYESPQQRADFVARLTEETRLENLQLTLRRADGTTVHVFENTYGVFDEERRLLEIRGHIADVTKVVRLEEQVRRAQKMEAVGRLAGGIAHDFNNVLTAIRGRVHLLLDELPENDAQRAELEEIDRSAGRAASLTRQLLAFSRQQMVRRAPIELNRKVSELQRMFERLLGEDIGFDTQLDPDLPLILADPTQIEQVIANLVVNARDAMPGGGRITVSTSTVDLGPEADVHLDFAAVPGRYVLLCVADSGIGMDETTQAHIFEPFFTTKELGNGTGLGLATVYGIVKQTNGYIRVLSSPGTGTTFEIYLPQMPSDSLATAAPVAASPRQSAGENPRGTETVLVVEDEAPVRQLVKAVLERQGYRVLEAPEGRTALALAAQRSEPFDLVLTDLVMPDLRGEELGAQLSAAYPGIRLLFMSGYDFHQLRGAGSLPPGAAFLEKPFTPAELLPQSARGPRRRELTARHR